MLLLLRFVVTDSSRFGRVGRHPGQDCRDEDNNQGEPTHWIRHFHIFIPHGFISFPGMLGSSGEVNSWPFHSATILSLFMEAPWESRFFSASLVRQKARPD